MAEMFPPKKNTAFTLILTIRDADGDLVSGATGLDSEVSIDGGAYADCTNEATEIGSSGTYSLVLPAGEMNGDVITVVTKTTSSGAKTAVNVIYTAVRTITDLAFPNTSGRGMDVDASGGVEVGSFQANAITTAAFNDGALTNAKFADGALTAAKFAAGAFDAVWTVAARALTAFGFSVGLADGAITEPKIAAGAFTASKFAAGAFDAVWSVAARLLTAGTNIVLAKGTGVTGFNDISSADAQTASAAALTAFGTATAAGVATRASQVSVDDIPTNAELATALTIVINAIRGADSIDATQLKDQIAALNNASVASIVAAMKSEAYEGVIDFETIMRVLLAFATGISSGMQLSGASDPVFRNPQNTADIFHGHMDASRNRTSVGIDI